MLARIPGLPVSGALIVVVSCFAAACRDVASSQGADDAAVFESLADQKLRFLERPIVSLETDTSSGGYILPLDEAELSQFVPEISQAIDDLRARRGDPFEFPDSFSISGSDRRLSADSVARILER